MQTWSITLHGPSGKISTLDTGEAQFVLGTETAPDVFTVHGDGVGARHAWLWISESALEVEDLAGGTFVNGHQITERVHVEYPASVQVGEVVLLVEVKEAVVEPSVDVTIPLPAPAKNPSSTDVTIPQRTPTRGDVPKTASTETAPDRSTSANKASPTCEYTLVREIARGGMGQIYFGEDPQLERQVAVKVSSVAYGGEDPRFSKEAKVLAQLAHPNIVPIHNIGVDGQGRPFYSMKLVKGRTLQAVLNLIRDGDHTTAGEYPLATLLTIFRKVCDAMMFAHSKGILHRDLKPENIMVGEYGEVLVMDWGLAKVLGEQDSTNASSSRANDTGDYGMTIEGEVMGTPQYMSPEQAEGMVAELDQRSDIYSLGGILYAILTLRPPIEGTILDEVLTKVKKGEIRSMMTKRGSKRDLVFGTPAPMEAEVPEALQAVTLKAMAREREKRYASVEAFAGDIEAYQNGFATDAEDAGTFKRIKLWVARNKVLAGAAAAMLVVVSGFTLKVFVEGRRASRAIQNLSELAPLVARDAEESLREGKFEEGLSRASYAVKLDAGIAGSYVILGNALQVSDQWDEAARAYRQALQIGFSEAAGDNLSLVEELLSLARSSGMKVARAKLTAALKSQGRDYEAVEYSRISGLQPVSLPNPEAGRQLMKQLEVNIRPVPGTGVMMQKTEFTVGQWKLYLAALGLPSWEPPEEMLRKRLPNPKFKTTLEAFVQTDEHPVVFVPWDHARDLCRWLTKETGDEWRLPREQEWLSALGDQPQIGRSKDGLPDGNVYFIKGEVEKKDPVAKKSDEVGIAGVYGTTPVGFFKPNAQGFHDLGGNVWEYMWDGASKPGNHVVRGGGWRIASEKISTLRGEIDYVHGDSTGGADIGFRLVVKKRRDR